MYRYMEPRTADIQLPMVLQEMENYYFTKTSTALWKTATIPDKLPHKEQLQQNKPQKKKMKFKLSIHI